MITAALNGKRRRESIDEKPRNHIKENTQSVYHAIMKRSTYSQRSFGRTIDVSGRLTFSRYKCSNNNIYQFLFPDNEFCTPFVCDFSYQAHDGHVLAVGDEEGRLSLLRTDKNNDPQNMQYHHSFYCHKHTIADVRWSKDDTMLATASHDRLMRLWDTETRSSLAEFAGHSDIVKSVNWHPTNEHILVTSSKDGSVCVWDTRVNQKKREDPNDFSSIPVYKPINTISAAHTDTKGQTKSTKKSGVTPSVIRSVTSALFLNSDETKIISSGSVDGTIKLWDLRLGKPKTLQSTVFETTIAFGAKKRHGITDLKIDHSGTRLFSSCMDNNIYMHYLTDLSKPAKKFNHVDYKIDSYDTRISLSPDDKFMISGSHDKDVFMWEVERPQSKPHVYEGHSQKVSGVAWNKRHLSQFASCSNDFTVRIWNRDGQP